MEIMAPVHGTEMEWPVQIPRTPITESSGAPLECTHLQSSEFDRYARAYFQHHPYIGASVSKTFLENGSRFYADIGAKRETTTPEDTSYMSTVTSEITNERMMFDILTTPARNRQDALEPLGAFALQKRVVDSQGHHWGYHESYSVPTDISFDSTGLALMGIHLATRNIFCGSGFLGRSVSGKTAQFYTAQKATGMYDDFSTSSTRDRPVVHIKDEVLASSGTYKRLHVISGDPFMNPWKGMMQLGTTSLVTELSANGVDAKQFGFEPLGETAGLARFVRKLATDATGSTETFDVALDMQQKLLKLAAELPLSAEQQQVVDEWSKILFDLKKRDFKRAGNRVEWVLRRDMLARHHDKSGVAMASDEMLQHDRRFDRIDYDADSKNRSIGLALREGAWSEWMPSEELIAERKTTAPSTTRAALRSRFIKAFHHLNNHSVGGSARVQVEWDSVRVDQKYVRLGDPYATSDDYLDEVIGLYASKAA